MFKNKMIIIIMFSTFIINSLCAEDISKLAKELNLYAGTKASIQWERIFSSERRLKKYSINDLSQTKKYKLKKYLVNHAADSEKPIVPGL